MSHTIYQTEGIILAKNDFGEADSCLTIFTEKFGKINAVAQGVRYLKSKLRYNLEKFSYSRLGLVLGKTSNGPIWRIVDAEEKLPLNNFRKEPEKLKIFSHIANLLNRMVQGEEKNAVLWQETKNTLLTLNRKELSQKDFNNIEISLFFCILAELGYIDKNKDYESKKGMVEAINKAIKESML